eukprot:GFKZ01014554.1.p2 GENE.GFKZ01014554.1~~GFKZ01014554.1.p2  ORF type:complete len:309 (-),score=53.97 GFKZ01014554.1:2015-2941(-)
MPPAVTVLAGIGCYSLLMIVARVLRFITQYFLASFSFNTYKGKWAAVTGASAGIGAGFVRALAKRGMNVILLARSQEKMEALAKEIGDKYGVQSKVVPFDFGAADVDSYAKLADTIADLAPNVLVNNVGVNVEMPTEFLDMDTVDVDRIVHVNITSINKMTALLLPGMVSDRQGLVINMSSGGGVVAPAPLLAVYGGTKAYADAFAVALSGEVKEKGVFAVSMTPFFVESAMAKMRRSLTVPSADAFADMALKQVAVAPRLSPHWIHEIMGVFLNILPLSVQVKKVTEMHRSIRKRAIRKKEKMAKKN